MPMSLVQWGLIVQQEFAKLLMMGSRGLIEVASPLSDDERRDYEIHVRGQYGFGLAFQVKSAMGLRLVGGTARYLRINFPVRAARLVNNPLYWYFFAYLDPTLMRFADPVFLIPSTVFHEHAAPKRHGDFWTFTMMASMEAITRDYWHPYRVNTLDLGARVLEIMRELQKHAVPEQAAELLAVPDVVWAQAATARAWPKKNIQG
jgi:hypothetical protein